MRGARELPREDADNLMMTLALSLAPVAAAAPSAAPKVRRGPDFAPYISSDEAIVVSIHTTRTVPSIDLGDDDDAWVPANSLGRTLPKQLPTAWQPRQVRSLASGFIISHDGRHRQRAAVIGGDQRPPGNDHRGVRYRPRLRGARAARRATRASRRRLHFRGGPSVALTLSSFEGSWQLTHRSAEE